MPRKHRTRRSDPYSDMMRTTTDMAKAMVGLGAMSMTFSVASELMKKK